MTIFFTLTSGGIGRNTETTTLAQSGRLDFLVQVNRPVVVATGEKSAQQEIPDGDLEDVWRVQGILAHVIGQVVVGIASRLFAVGEPSVPVANKVAKYLKRAVGGGVDILWHLLCYDLQHVLLHQDLQCFPLL